MTDGDAEGVVLTGATIARLDLARIKVSARFVCRDCAIGVLSAEGSRWAREVRLDGSSVAEGLDFSAARFAAGLSLRDVVVEGEAGVRLDAVRVDGALGLDGALSRGPVALAGAQLGALSARGAGFAAMILADASVAGEADLRGLTVLDAFDASGATFGRSLSMRGFESLAAPDLASASVGRALRLDGAVAPGLSARGLATRAEVVLSGATLEGPVALDGARIGGDLWIRSYDGAPPPVLGDGQGRALSLNNAEIGGRIDVAGATFRGGIGLDAVRVDEDIWLRAGSRVEGPIVAVYARIGQNLDLTDAALGDLDATGARIGGELRLGSPDDPARAAPRWREGARLSLRNAEAMAVVDAIGGESGDCEVRPWPDSLDVIGFTYRRIGGLGGGGEAAREACGFHRDWLTRQKPFSLDPYRRFADLLDASGRATAARQVRWDAKERQFAEASGPEWVRLALQRVFVGYGIYTGVVFVWMAAFALFGAIVFSRAPEARSSPVPLGLLFSVDMLLPFVTFRRAHADIDLASPARHYLYFHKFMGWVFALFFASALGGLFAV